MNAATPGQALHEALRQSAAVEFDLDIESFETWDHIRPSQRNRLEAAAQAAIAAQEPAPTLAVVDLHRWYAVITQPDGTSTVIGTQGRSGLGQYDSVDAWEAVNS